MPKEVVTAFTVVEAIDLAPLALYVMFVTPLPPWLSSAVRRTVAFVLFQPAKLAPGEFDAEVEGATGSGPGSLGGVRIGDCRLLVR